MMNDIGKVVFDKLQELKEENGGTIDVNNVDAIVDKFSEIIKSHVNSENDLAIYSEIEKISQQIKSTKDSVSQVDTDKMNEDFPDATLQLRSVTTATERSTEIILTKIEEIQDLTSKIQDPEVVRVIQDNAIAIMEACNFQDITGQRISKVIKTLDEVEKIVSKLISTFKPKNDEKSTNAKSAKETDADLLNGPQLEGQAPSQQQIDDLFNNG